MSRNIEVATQVTKATTPWKPARIMDIPSHLKDPAFTYRWCDKKKEGNIQKKESEGWIIDKELSKKMTTLANKTIVDGTPLDGTMQLRELIVMKMPKEMAAERAIYYARKSSKSMEDAKKKFETEARGIGGEYTEGHYGSIKGG